MKITTYEYKKVPVKDTEIFIPNEPFYCFKTHVRSSIRIIPKFVTWDNDPNNKKGNIFKLEITCVNLSFECKVEKFEILISQVEGHINHNTKDKESEICYMLLNEDYLKRTEKEFNNDLESAIKSFTNVD